MPQWPWCGLASPQPLRPHAPEPATGQRDSRRGPSAFAKDRAAVSPSRLARPVPAGCGEIGHPRHRRMESPPSQKDSFHLPSRSAVNREGGGEMRPAGLRSHLGCACGRRAGVPARSLAQAGGRAALDGQPERVGSAAAGQERRLYAVENEKRVAPPAGLKKKLHTVKWKRQPRGAKRKSRHAVRKRGRASE